MFRKRSFIKLLILVPILWIVVLFMISINDNNGSAPSSVQLAADKEKLKLLEAQNNRLIAEAAQKHEEEKRRNLDNHNHREDVDHPEEERKKAEEQQKNRAGPIQVHAPVENNPNAPGNSFVLFFRSSKFSPLFFISYNERFTFVLISLLILDIEPF